MKIYKRVIGCILLAAMLVCTLNINVYAQISTDEALVQTYVESVNDEEWLNLPGLFCAEEEFALQAILSEESNQTNHIGVYNVTQIHDYEMYEIEDYEGVEYSDYCNVVEYLLYFDCSVNESDVFFKEGDNYFRLVIGTEGNTRKILELSVASDDCLEKITETDSEILSVVEYTEYANDRNEVIDSLDGYETLVVQEEDNCNQGISTAAQYGPKTLLSYAFPSTIKIRKTSDGQVYTRNFKNYCYVVLASEFSCGTDGEVLPHMNALRANALCIRNVGWYRTLYPLSATGGYHITDSSSNAQNYEWGYESTVSTTFSRQVTAVNNIWAVMMFDCDKKLFYAPYGSGSYNGNRNTTDPKLYQNGANYLATELGYDYKDILHYYYDNVNSEKITYGTIVICNYHNKATTYTARAEGHGQKCTTCGYIEFTAHTWKYCGSYNECTVCKYRTSSTQN